MDRAGPNVLHNLTGLLAHFSDRIGFGFGGLSGCFG
jgi:hypothetical protein